LGSICTIVPLDYLIHGFGGWGRVSMVYSLGVGAKGPTLVRFHIIKEKLIRTIKGNCI